MAREFKVFALLWLIVACLVLGGAEETLEVAITPTPTTTEDPTTTSIPTTTEDPTTPPTPTTTEDPTTPPTPTTTEDPTITSIPTTTEDPTTTSIPTTTEDPTATSTLTTPEVPTTTPSSEVSTPPPTPDPCDEKPCGDGSTCEPRYDQTFVCLCLAGATYNNVSKKCESAKIFPGNLNLPGMPYDAEMANIKSKVFREKSEAINNELKTVFKDDDNYSGSTVQKLRSSEDSIMTRSEGSTVIAEVDIIFNTDSPIDMKGVEDRLEAATDCGSCLLNGSSFTATNLCDDKPCDLDTTTCLSGSGTFNCTCKDKYVPSIYSKRMCIACPSGERADGTECVLCDFGYSGFDCQENWKLVLTIVGSVLGGLLLITLILLPVVAHISKKKGSKKNKSAKTETPYVSNAPAKAPLVNGSLANSQTASVNGQANGLSAFANAGVPRIPRATTTNSWDSRTNLEMTPSNSRQNLLPGGRNSRFYENPDDMNPYAQSRPQSSLYSQPRPQNNPYAQTRPQMNPYAPSQGHSNHSYLPDNGRRF